MRRQLLCRAAFALAAGVVLPRGAAAQDAGLLTIVVPAPPGGANDTLARLLAARWHDATGQTVLVLNKPGGNLVVGTQFVANSPRDGRTLLLVGNSAVTVNPALTAGLPYDPVKDLQPVSQVATLEMVLAVNPSLPVNSVEQFVAYTKAHPDAVNCAAGTPIFQLAMERFKQLSGAKLTQIPYTGTAKAITALLAGEVQATISEATSAVPHIKLGRLKALAGFPHVNALPELPPITASLPSFDMTVWLGLFASGGTPPAIVQKLSADVARILALPGVREQLSGLGMAPVGGTPDALAQAIRHESVEVRALVKSAGLLGN